MYVITVVIIIACFTGDLGQAVSCLVQTKICNALNVCHLEALMAHGRVKNQQQNDVFKLRLNELTVGDI